MDVDNPEVHNIDDDDQVVHSLPIFYSNLLEPSIHLHQFPLLARPLQVPPSAAQAGKVITVRHKPKSNRIEIQVPVDTRPEVWNRERSQEYGFARARDDAEQDASAGLLAGGKKVKDRERELAEGSRLGEVRMQSEQVTEKGVYMLGIVRKGEQIHVYPERLNVGL